MWHLLDGRQIRQLVVPIKPPVGSDEWNRLAHLLLELVQQWNGVPHTIGLSGRPHHSSIDTIMATGAATTVVIAFN